MLPWSLTSSLPPPLTYARSMPGTPNRFGSRAQETSAARRAPRSRVGQRGSARARRSSGAPCAVAGGAGRREDHAAPLARLREAHDAARYGRRQWPCTCSATACPLLASTTSVRSGRPSARRRSGSAATSTLPAFVVKPWSEATKTSVDAGRPSVSSVRRTRAISRVGVAQRRARRRRADAHAVLAVVRLRQPVDHHGRPSSGSTYSRSTRCVHADHGVVAVGQAALGRRRSEARQDRPRSRRRDTPRSCPARSSR